MKITFVHGWGCAPNFWDGIIACLTDIDAHKVDLGFIGSAPPAEAPPQPSLFVTHSLGTMWALKHHKNDMTGLVAINGFAAFTDFAPPRILKTMQRNLRRDPHNQMEEFWNAYNLPHHQDINPQKLEQGLDWLAQWNCEAERSSLSVPVLSLIGGQDALLEEAKMQQHWRGHKTETHQGAGHDLPTAQAEWCADKIKECADAL